MQVLALHRGRLKGRVARTSGAPDRTKRTLRGEIDLPNREGKRLPDVYGTVAVRLGQD